MNEGAPISEKIKYAVTRAKSAYLRADAALARRVHGGKASNPEGSTMQTEDLQALQPEDDAVEIFLSNQLPLGSVIWASPRDKVHFPPLKKTEIETQLEATSTLTVGELSRADRRQVRENYRTQHAPIQEREVIKAGDAPSQNGAVVDGVLVDFLKRGKMLEGVKGVEDLGDNIIRVLEPLQEASNILNLRVYQAEIAANA